MPRPGPLRMNSGAASSIESMSMAKPLRLSGKVTEKEVLPDGNVRSPRLTVELGAATSCTDHDWSKNTTSTGVPSAKSPEIW